MIYKNSIHKFIFITFLWSWVIWIPLILFSYNIISIPEILLSTIKVPLMMLGAFGPLIGTYIVLIKKYGKSFTKKYFLSFLDLNIGWKAYTYPLFIFGISTFIAWYLPELFGLNRLVMLLPSIWIYFPCLLFMILVGGGQEEFGWRGYALPILEMKYGYWFSNILLGVIWTIWHLPLWFISNTSQSFMNFGGAFLLFIGYSFIFSWIKKLANQKPFAGVYSHGLANSLISIMPTISMTNGETQPRFWIWAMLTLFIGIVINFLRIKKII